MNSQILVPSLMKCITLFSELFDLGRAKLLFAQNLCIIFSCFSAKFKNQEVVVLHNLLDFILEMFISRLLHSFWTSLV